MAFESFPKPEEQKQEKEGVKIEKGSAQEEIEKAETQRRFPELYGKTREYYAKLYDLPKDSSYEKIKQKMDEATDKGFDKDLEDISQESDLFIRLSARKVWLSPETSREEIENSLKARLEIDRYEQKLKNKYIDDPMYGDRKIEATKLGLPETTSWKEIWTAKDEAIQNKIQKYKELYPEGKVGDKDWFKYLNQRVLERAEELRKQRLEKTK